MNHQINSWLRLLIVPAALLLTGCLDENPKDQVPEEEVYGTADALIQNTVATLYNYIGGNADSQGLQGTTRGVYDLNELTSDEAIIPTRGGDWYDGGLWQHLYLHQWTASDAPLLNTWNYLYKVIVLCNRSIARLEANQHLLTADQRQACIGEVRALRAMFYYYLLDLFARVPLVVSEDVPLAEVMQSSRSQVFWFVADELQAALPHLAREHSNYEGAYYGRMTAPVAWFLLAKLALNAEVYTDDDWTDGNRPDGKNIFITIDGTQMNMWEACIAWCDKLKDFGYELDNDAAAPFLVHNESSHENIFTIPMDKTLYSNQFCNLFRSRHYTHGSALGMGAENGTSATLTTIRTFGYGTEEQDNRFDINFFSGPVYVDGQPVMLDNNQQLNYRPLAVTAVDLTGTEYEKTAGARMHKYEIDRMAYSDGNLQDNDIVLFRYADVLLMRSEALLRNGQDGSADLNSIRQRANMPPRLATLDNLLDERMLELCWEGWRRQDLVRFGKYHLPYDLRPQQTGEGDAHTTVFPIPEQAIDLNSHLQQNPGYGR